MCQFENNESPLLSSSTRTTVLMTLAGDPTATLNGGMSLVTTLPHPIVHPSPIVTPGRTIVPPPIQQSLPMVTCLEKSIPSRRDCTSVSCVAAKMATDGPRKTRSPIVTRPQSKMTKLAHFNVSLELVLPCDLLT